MASESAQLESAEQTATGGAPAHGADGLPVSDFKVVASAPKVDTSDLYSFRVTMNPPAEPAAKPQRPKSALGPVLILAVLAGLGALAVFAAANLIKPKPPALYIDLATRRFDPAALNGRLMMRWDNGPAYQLSIDPTDQQQIAGFAAAAQDPPFPLSITLRLRDSSGKVKCQKQILFPAPEAGDAQALDPQKTASGDTVQNVAGEDGRIAEIDITGGLACSLKTYDQLVAWDFSTNFPTLAQQADWLKHEAELAALAKPHPKRAGGLYSHVQHLAAPIEGEDVIVGDNPSRGTVETGDGRVFLVGASGWRGRTTEWQVFPANIHFRCDKSGLCLLRRDNSHSALQARLLK